jgi:hypothetical protein
MDVSRTQIEANPLVEIAPDEAVLPALEQTGGTPQEFIEANRSDEQEVDAPAEA